MTSKREIGPRTCSCRRVSTSALCCYRSPFWTDCPLLVSRNLRRYNSRRSRSADVDSVWAPVLFFDDCYRSHFWSRSYSKCLVSDLIVQAKSGTGKTCVFCTIALDSLILENSATQVSQCSHVVLHHAFINKALVSTVKFYYRKLIVFWSSNLIRLTIFLSERIGQYK